MRRYGFRALIYQKFIFFHFLWKGSIFMKIKWKKSKNFELFRAWQTLKKFPVWLNLWRFFGALVPQWLSTIVSDLLLSTESNNININNNNDDIIFGHVPALQFCRVGQRFVINHIMYVCHQFGRSELRGFRPFGTILRHLNIFSAKTIKID